MKHIFLIIVSFFYFGTVAHAETNDECILDVAALSSDIDDSNPSVKTLRAPKIENRAITHVVLIASGAKVEFSAGGCAHYGFSYAFSELKQMPKDRKALFSFVRDQVKLVPLKEDNKFLAEMIDTLERASHEPENWQTPTSLGSAFGDAYVYLSIEENGFTLSYDFAL